MVRLALADELFFNGYFVNGKRQFRNFFNDAVSNCIEFIYPYNDT
jgi:hypothetical protein